MADRSDFIREVHDRDGPFIFQKTLVVLSEPFV